MNKQTGQALAHANNQAFVSVLREYAVNRAKKVGEVHIDHVRQYAEKHGMKPKSHHAWGVIFNDRRLKKSGEYRASKVPTNHQHASPVWVAV